MNITAARWAMSVPPVGSSARYVLLALACHADKHGNAWVSASSMATDTELDRMTVLRSLSVLETAGLVDVERARGHQNTYRLLFTTSDRPSLPTSDAGSLPPATLTSGTSDSDAKTSDAGSPNGIDGKSMGAGVDAEPPQHGGVDATFLRGTGWITDVGEVADVTPDPTRNVSKVAVARAALRAARAQNLGAGDG